MNLSRISRQLRREVTTHPKKAAILGLLCLVALWFWAPLVWGWIDEDDPATGSAVAPPAANSAPAPSSGTPAASNATLKKPESPQWPWHQLVQWMDNDLRTSATNPVLGRRDPFLIPRTETVKVEPEDQPEQTPPAATPEALGMVLSSTIIGPHRRVAQINGKSYRQGEAVKLVKDGQQIEFTLAAVYPRRIVLKRKREQFELTIPVPARSGRIELSRNKD